MNQKTAYECKFCGSTCVAKDACEECKEANEIPWDNSGIDIKDKEML